MATLRSPATTGLVARLRDVSAGLVVELAPGSVAAGRARCDSLGLDTRWHVGRLEDLSTMTASRDDYAAALSSVGVILVADPLAALDATADRPRPGGAVLLPTWDADGYVAGRARATAAVLPEQERGPATTWVRWGRADVVRSRLESAGLVDLSPGHVAGARGSADGGAARRCVRRSWTTSSTSPGWGARRNRSTSRPRASSSRCGHESAP